MTRLASLVLALIASAGCSDEPARPPPPPTWDCPGDWVPTAVGGCMPPALATGAAPIAEGPEPPAGIPTCAAGWERSSDGTCDPSLATDCAAGSEPLPGGGCTETAVCPAAEYADPGPESAGARIVHVRAGADPAMADGSAASPYATVRTGITAAGAGGWVLIAEGTYPEAIDVPASTHLIGVCPERVAITGGAARPTLSVGARRELGLRGVTLSGPYTGLLVTGGGMARVEGVRVRGAAVRGIHVSMGAVLEANDLLIADTEGDAMGADGMGMLVGSGSSATCTRCAFAGNHRHAAAAIGVGTTLLLADTLIRDTLPQRSDGRHGTALLAGDSATLRAERVVVTGSANGAAQVNGAPARIDLVDAVVARTGTEDDSPATPVALRAIEGATLSAERVLIEQTIGTGAVADGEGSTMEVRASVIRETAALRDGFFGYGVAAQLGGHAIVQGTRVETATVTAVACGTEGSRCTVEDSVLADVRPFLTNGFAYAVQADLGATVEVTRSWLERAEGIAVICHRASHCNLRETVVRDVLVDDSGTFGIGVYAMEGSTLTVTGGVIDGCSESGIVVRDTGTTGMLTDVIVQRIASSARGLGTGVHVNPGASLTATRLAIHEASGAAVAAVSDEDPTGGLAALTAMDLFVRGTRRSTVGLDETTRMPVGRPVSYGIYVGPRSRIEATHAVIDGGGHGFYDAHGALALHASVVAGQVDAFGGADLDESRSDESLLLDEVASHQNASDEVVSDPSLPRTAELPLPTPVCITEPC